MRIITWQSNHSGGLWHLPGVFKDKNGVTHHWLLTFYWWVAMLLALFLMLNIILYLAMSSYTLPFTQVNGVQIGLQSKTQAIATLEDAFNERPISVTIEEETYSFSLSELGITIDSEETYSNLRNVNGFASLPIVKIFTNPMVRDLPQYEINRSMVADELSGLVDATRVEPTNAQLIVPELAGAELSISDSASGYEISGEILADQLITAMRASASAPTDVRLQERVLPPSIREQQLQGTLIAANDLLEGPVVVLNEQGTEITRVTPTTLRRMLTTDDAAKLVFDNEKLRMYLREELAQYFFDPPTHTRITAGETTTRGVNGSQLDLEAAFTSFQTEVTNGSSQITLSSEILKPAKIVDGNYPKTDMGLHALITDFDNEKRGDYRVIVHQLRGGDIRATHQGVTSSIPASTYKAFIAYAAMWATEQGEMTLEDQTSRGTVDACLYETLHFSTDYCAFAIQDYMGWQRIDDILKLNGIENSFFANEDRIADKFTTAQDEYTLYRRLYDGTLLNPDHTEHLLTMLKEQMWRSGIPGGSSPSTVANKVGFYDGWINDVGIVYGEDADYIIVALSDGGSFWEINDLSRRIYNFFED